MHICRIFLLILLTLPVFGQKKITLSDCFEQYKFYPDAVEGFSWLRNGRQYTSLEQGIIRLHDVESQALDSVLWDIPIDASDYTLSANEKTVLITREKTSVYRHSSLANYVAITGAKKPSISIGGDDAILQTCVLAPDGDKALYVRDNNLYYQSFANGAQVQITTDGKKNAVINGIPDWLYEEEFSKVDEDGLVAAKWSPDGTKIAFIRFDETAVQEFTLVTYNDEMYPQTKSYKYPKVGTPNARVSVHIYDLITAQVKEVQTGPDTDRYLPRINWTHDNQLVATRLNRHQDSLQLYICKPDFRQDGATLGSRVLLTETDSAYVDMGIHDFLTFTKDNKHFIWGSERDGTAQLYLYDMQGNLVRKLTQGKENITAFYGVDEQKKLLYVQTTFAPVMRMIWEMPMEPSGGEVRIMSGEGEGYHEAGFSPTFDYWVHKSQNMNKVPVYQMRRRDGSVVRVLLDNAKAAKARIDYGFVDKELFTITINKNTKMNCWILKPPGFDGKKKLPVLIDVYGGPGSQTVTFEYDGHMDAWRQMLAQMGYLVVQVDNRGTGGRSRDFKKSTQMQLGKLETEDQILAARYLRQLEWVDGSRIGIWGWSYGGFLSTNAMLKGDSTFKAAIAVAPVTNWKWYDSAYTERYLHTYAENPKGYDNNSPVNYADKLRGKYLLCHGMADDNVHWQHSVALTDALIKAGKQFETYYYPNRDHGIYTDGATMHLFTKITDFILKNL
jgi:dipeptidyl-peptidase 4